MDTRRRATIAALVGLVGAVVLVPGAGHVYLRKWRRAVAWFLVGVTCFAALTATFAADSTTVDGLPSTVLVPYFLFLTLSVLDAYVVARRTPASRLSTPSALGGVEEDSSVVCESCGRAVDPELTFCWYCTTPVSDAEGE